MFRGAMVLIPFAASRPRDRLFVPVRPLASIAASHRRELEIPEPEAARQGSAALATPVVLAHPALAETLLLPALPCRPRTAPARCRAPRDQARRNNAPRLA